MYYLLNAKLEYYSICGYHGFCKYHKFYTVIDFCDNELFIYHVAYITNVQPAVMLRLSELDYQFSNRTMITHCAHVYYLCNMLFTQL